MGFASFAKAATAASQTYPSSWPSNWTWNTDDAEFTAWPPGWPETAAEDYVGAIDSIANVIYNAEGSPTNTSTVTFKLFDEDGETPADALEYHRIEVTLVDGDGESLTLEKSGDGEGEKDVLYYQVTNFAGSDYGFTDDITFGIDANTEQPIVLTCSVVSVYSNVTDTESMTISVGGG